MNKYLLYYGMLSGLWFPVVLNNWLRVVTDPFLLFILGSIWVVFYCFLWAKEMTKEADEK